jgi:hypothetical protein
VEYEFNKSLNFVYKLENSFPQATQLAEQFRCKIITGLQRKCLDSATMPTVTREQTVVTWNIGELESKKEPPLNCISPSGAAV